MKNNKGFTLTEILLAVMIVGIIGVALAALTTASSREAGVGRSRVLLRNNLSLAMRQLRQDVHSSTQLQYARGQISSASAGNVIPLLVLARNVDLKGNPLPGRTPSYITYCFVVGSHAAQPSGALAGGTIYRRESEQITWSSATPSCGSNPATDTNFQVFLHNVKFIPSGITVEDRTYPVPLFRVDSGETTYSLHEENHNILRWYYGELGALLRVNLITELPSKPVVNDVVEQKFMMQNGFFNIRGTAWD